MNRAALLLALAAVGTPLGVSAGALVRGQCVADQAAVTAECSASYPMTQVLPNGNVQRTSCTPYGFPQYSDATIRIEEFDMAGGGSYAAYSEVMLSFAFAPCDETEQWTDMAALWLLGIGALVVIWLLKQVVYKLVMPQ